MNDALKIRYNKIKQQLERLNEKRLKALGEKQAAVKNLRKYGITDEAEGQELCCSLQEQCKQQENEIRELLDQFEEIYKEYLV